jgi:hypothetical protein
MLASHLKHEKIHVAIRDGAMINDGNLSCAMSKSLTASKDNG